MSGIPIVELSGLEVRYGRHRRSAAVAVRDVSLSVSAGEIVAVVGESGSGKTTTAHALIGMLPATGAVTAGRILVRGEDVTHARDRVLDRIRGRVVALIPQDPMVGLNPTQRIRTQVAEAVRLRARRADAGEPPLDVDHEVRVALRDAGIDDPDLRAAQYPHELSGGLRQRVLIAIALAGQPDLIIADEPTSALDVTVQKRILDHLQSLVTERGIALLIITHDLAVAADRADRVIVMKDGEIVEQGVPDEILVAPAVAYTRALVAAAPGLDDSGGLRLRHTRVVPAEEVLALDRVSRSFPLAGGGRLVALDDVSLTVRRGQTLALVGESGSGKSTALRIANGLVAAASGAVRLDGEDLGGASERRWRRVRRRLQLVQQNPFASLDPRFTVEEAIAEPLEIHRVGSRRSRRDRVHDLLALVDLPSSFAERLPAELSGGQRQRVAIARALALDPEVVLLDEPVSALDVSVQAQVLELLARLQDDLGVSYLFVSHDLSVVASLAHEVVVLSAGRVVEAGTANAVLTTPESEQTRALVGAIPGRAHARRLAEAGR